jgi:1-acyl-sn-glycerol-3-phosphate acyltransferase
VAFPEGTTTNGQAVLNFHTSLLQPALLTKSPIQPVALQYQGVAAQQAAFVGDDEFIPHLLKMLSLDKIEVRVSFLPIINSSGKDRHTVGAAARAAILEAITLGWIDNLEHQLRQAD